MISLTYLIDSPPFCTNSSVDIPDPDLPDFVPSKLLNNLEIINSFHMSELKVNISFLNKNNSLDISLDTAEIQHNLRYYNLEVIDLYTRFNEFRYYSNQILFNLNFTKYIGEMADEVIFNKIKDEIHRYNYDRKAKGLPTFVDLLLYFLGIRNIKFYKRD